MLALTVTVTVALDLVTAVVVGDRAWRSSSPCARWPAAPAWNRCRSTAGDHSAEEHALLAEHIVAYRLDGPLFFAAAHRFLLELSEVADVRVVILRMSRVTTIDATGAHVLGDAITRLRRRGITVLLSGIATGHDQVLAALGVAEHLRRDGLIFPDTPAAIAYARAHILHHVGGEPNEATIDRRDHSSSPPGADQRPDAGIS